MPFSIPRERGCILTQTRERYYQLALDSYDRLFPNQDTLPNAR
ncbi:TOTE conflict system archaeo-eukaryotic primase domain-containing protein [Paenibacillus arenilitoris]